MNVCDLASLVPSLFLSPCVPVISLKLLSIPIREILKFAAKHETRYHALLETRDAIRYSRRIFRAHAVARAESFLWY